MIPEKVEIAGTFRTFGEEWRKEAKEIDTHGSCETGRQKRESPSMSILLKAIRSW
ncbi:MAG: hypothetical protein MZV63_68790 [Marinilabiliales bacterium]|nr:hypothetical protein [Marinilabiliales bacterium]